MAPPVAPAFQVMTVTLEVMDLRASNVGTPGVVGKVVMFRVGLTFDAPTLFTAFTRTEYLVAGSKLLISMLWLLEISCGTVAQLYPPPFISTT